MRRRISFLIPAIVASVAASCDEDAMIAPPFDAAGDATADAQAHDATVDANDAGLDADAARDSYVAWCEAGPPLLIADAGCALYFDVPCGLPSGLVVDDAGTIDRCDQICIGAQDDLCAQLPPWFTDVFLDAGLIDAATAQTVEAGATFIICACQGSAGRRPEGLDVSEIRATSELGAFFARAACLEAASVHAFARMRDELRALGAPRALVRAASRAIADERRHARVVAGLARRFGGRPSRLRLPRPRPRSVEAIAIENAVEGQVNETFGAVLATWQARHARDERVRNAYARIALDETRHAQLAHDAASFFEGLLDRPARRRVARARRDAFVALARSAEGDVRGNETAGLPAEHQLRALAATFTGKFATWQTFGMDARKPLGHADHRRGCP